MSIFKRDEQLVFDWYKEQYFADRLLESSLENVLQLARVGNEYLFATPGSGGEKSTDEIIAEESLYVVEEKFFKKVFNRQ